MADVRAFVPPTEPHTARYQWVSGQQAHRVGNTTVYGDPAVILSASDQAHRECERYDLDELPGDAVEEIIDAREDDNAERVAEIVAEHRDDDAEAGASESSAEDGAVLDSEGGTRGEADAETLDSEGGTRGEADEETLDTEGEGPDSAPEIPADLDSVPYRGDRDADDTDSLQDLAQAHGIAATQSAADLREALAEERDDGGDDLDGVHSAPDEEGNSDG